MLLLEYSNKGYLWRDQLIKFVTLCSPYHNTTTEIDCGWRLTANNYSLPFLQMQSAWKMNHFTWWRERAVGKNCHSKSHKRCGDKRQTARYRQLEAQLLSSEGYIQRRGTERVATIHLDMHVYIYGSITSKLRANSTTPLYPISRWTIPTRASCVTLIHLKYINLPKVLFQRHKSTIFLSCSTMLLRWWPSAQQHMQQCCI